MSKVKLRFQLFKPPLCHSPGEIPPGEFFGIPGLKNSLPSGKAKTLGEVLEVNKSWLSLFIPTQHAQHALEIFN